jgi:penicillin G amidase
VSITRIRFQQTGKVTRLALPMCALLFLVWAGPAISAHAATKDAVVTETISLQELQQPVQILIDRWGVPHIYAKNEADLFFAQGFNAARDRLFQIDLWRRRGLGQLAEIFGSGFY